MIDRTTILLEMSPLLFCQWGGLPRQSVKNLFLGLTVFSSLADLVSAAGFLSLVFLAAGGA